MKELEPYSEHCTRDLLFRDAVLNYLGFNDKIIDPAAYYCEQCRSAGMDDCANCDKEFKNV